MKYKFLDNIDSPDDLKALKLEDLNVLSSEIRAFLTDNISKTGGHLSSNLGVVELTIALHKVFNSPKDKIIFDVGHQSYVHKLLTGRRESFSKLRKYKGLSGFTKIYESEHDIFGTGHSSTSISAALGIATAMKLNGDDGYVVAVIGDGALTGGLAYEGLNNAGRSNTNLIVVLNDNELSISKNVGSIAQYLSKITSRPSYFRFKDTTKYILDKIPVLGKHLYRLIHFIKTAIKNSLFTNFFEDLGFIYFGQIDGHDIKSLIQILNRAKEVGRPSVIHIKTTKGKGYSFAEDNPTLYHGVSNFDITSGIHSGNGNKTFSHVFAKSIVEAAKNDEKICAITAAMAEGVCLDEFAKLYKDRFFDVGIAESHAVTFSAGLAKEGMKPVFACYSTFLQRGYDQILHDVAIQKLPVVFAIDRCGFVGEDGETHQGLYDVSFLMPIPGISIYSPFSFNQLKVFINKAINLNSPVAVRYPRGKEHIPDELSKYRNSFDDVIFDDCENADIILITYGRVTGNVYTAKTQLKKLGIKVGIIILLKIKPIDIELIFNNINGKNVYFIEEGMLSGGVGEYIGTKILDKGFTGKYKTKAIENKFIPQGSIEEQYKLCGMDSESISSYVLNDLSEV